VTDSRLRLRRSVSVSPGQDLPRRAGHALCRGALGSFKFSRHSAAAAMRVGLEQYMLLRADRTVQGL
jgi:hypothetical protein